MWVWVLWPNDPSSATAVKTPDGSQSKRPSDLNDCAENGAAVRCSALVRRLFDTLFHTKITLKNTKLANQYLKWGWRITDVKTEYWLTGGGGFDSCFVYQMENRSRIFRLVAKYVNQLIFKRSLVVRGRPNLPDFQKNPPSFQSLSDSQSA